MDEDLPVLRFEHIGIARIYFCPRGVWVWNHQTHTEDSQPPGIYVGVGNPKSDEVLQDMWRLFRAGRQL